MWSRYTLAVLSSTVLTAKAQPPGMGDINNAGVARWMAEEASWGTLTTSVNPFDTDAEKDLFAGVSTFAASQEDGRIFFFLMDEVHLHGSALTLSQAAMTPGLFPVAGCGSMESAVDAQDPRCAKITYRGSIHPCSAEHSVGENCDEIGSQVLFEKYPIMADFPDDHNFHVHEFVVDSIWMIANFGGGGDVTSEEYHAAEPETHNIMGGSSVDAMDVLNKEPPAWEDYAARARWIVHHSLFTSVSTRTDDDTTFGNIRSITDGETLAKSTGLPKFYLPDVDPTAVDIQNENKLVLTFSEAALAQLVNDDGETCSGQMAGMPTCAQLSLYGKAIPNEDTDVLEHFGSYHPLAPWLAEGGSHMSGNYYTLEIEKIVLLDYFGGPKEVDVQEYLDYAFSSDDEEANTAPNHDENIHDSSSEGSSYSEGHGEGGYGHGEGHGEVGYGHGEGHGEGGYGHGEGHGEGGMNGHDHGGNENHASSSEFMDAPQEYQTPYLRICLAAFLGSYLATFTREKCASRRNRYQRAQKDDVSSLQLTVDTAEAC